MKPGERVDADVLISTYTRRPVKNVRKCAEEGQEVGRERILPKHRRDHHVPDHCGAPRGINLYWISQFTGDTRLVAIQARDIESIVYKIQDDAVADDGPIRSFDDLSTTTRRRTRFLALTLDKKAWVGNTLSRERFDPSQNPGPHCHIVLDLAGSAARVFTDKVLGFLFEHYSHATINQISGADAAAPYLLGVTDADAMEKRHRAMQNEEDSELAARLAAAAGAAQRRANRARR